MDYYIFDYYVAVEPSYWTYYNDYYEFKEESYVHPQEKILVGQQPIYGCDQYWGPSKEEFYLVRSPNWVTAKFKDNRVYTFWISEFDTSLHKRQSSYKNFFNGISIFFVKDDGLKNIISRLDTAVSSDQEINGVSLECKEEDGQLLSDKKDRGAEFSMPYEPYRRENNRLYFVVDYIRDDSQPHSGVGLYISKFGENFYKEAVEFFLQKIKDRTILKSIYWDPQYKFISHSCSRH